MVEQANELILDILPLSAQTARLVRVYGTAPCVALPGTLPAPAGGSLALTELGDYCFSEKPRKPPSEDTPREDLARKGPFSLHGPLESCTARRSCHPASANHPSARNPCTAHAQLGGQPRRKRSRAPHQRQRSAL